MVCGSPSVCSVSAGNCTPFTAAHFRYLMVMIRSPDWKVALPQIEQTRAQADHDGLIRSLGRQLVDLIRPIVLKARASG